ncbi:hypothetical protein AVEN_89937-1 [Araneus ventricosus]|uniref:Uncharacterized protein n=1 Tax=Araneus ventricosus TaxID=182803 RepID=A0A4Y2TK31_ARAVE|nr:hypothetical protein AVEN_89937-1 [Araneus ventricosus]
MLLTIQTRTLRNKILIGSPHRVGHHAAVMFYLAPGVGAKAGYSNHLSYRITSRELPLLGWLSHYGYVTEKYFPRPSHKSKDLAALFIFLACLALIIGFFCLGNREGNAYEATLGTNGRLCICLKETEESVLIDVYLLGIHDSGDLFLLLFLTNHMQSIMTFSILLPVAIPTTEWFDRHDTRILFNPLSTELFEVFYAHRTDLICRYMD